MGRPPAESTRTVVFRGITIRFYPTATGWEAYWKVPGQRRQSARGRDLDEAQANAEEKIRLAITPAGAEAGRDEDVARRILEPHGVSLTEAARFWTSQHSVNVKEAIVNDVRTRWLAVVESEVGFKQWKTSRDHTVAFAAKFGLCQIHVITAQQYLGWQDDCRKEGKSSRTIRNRYDAVKAMFNFAKSRECLATDRDTIMDAIPRPRAGAGKKEIFALEEMQKLLDAAWAMGSDGAVPMAITAFSAVRHEEMCPEDPDEPQENRLAWEDFKWEEGYIHVRPEVAKLSSDRYAALPDNLREMLQPRRGKGPVFVGTNLHNFYASIAARAGVKWKRNALRHSQITFGMRRSNNPAEVADQAGNSVAMIEAAYRKRGQSLADATAWFSLIPSVAWCSGIARRRGA